MTTEEKKQVYDVKARKDLVPSPTNPRKHFDPDRLQELADNLRQKGMIVPILVRPSTGGKFEIIAGERRWRAAELAKLDRLPVIVREMGDADVLEVQYIENLQREDLTALEEAEGFGKLIESGKYTPDTLADKLNKSRRHVYGRLKLLKLGKPVREALEGGAIDQSKAALIAQVVNPEMQKEVLKLATKGGGYRGPYSFRDLKQAIEDDFQRSLGDAAFDLKDPKLGNCGTSCVDCPKRSGNMKDLFPEITSADVCTDVPCYNKKLQAHEHRILSQAAGLGHDVMPAKVFEKKRWQLQDLSEKTDAPGRQTFKQLLVGSEVKPIIAVDEDGKIHEVLPPDKLKAALKSVGLAKYCEDAGDGSGRSSARAIEERKKTIFEGKVTDAAIAQMVAKVENSPEEFTKWKWFRLLVSATANSCWHDSMVEIMGGRGWKEKGKSRQEIMPGKVKEMTEAQLLGLLFEILLCRGLRGGWGIEEESRAAVKLFGIDRAAIAKELKAAAAKPKGTSVPATKGKVAAVEKGDKPKPSPKGKKKGGKRGK